MGFIYNDFVKPLQTQCADLDVTSVMFMKHVGWLSSVAARHTSIPSNAWVSASSAHITFPLKRGGA